VGNSQVANFFRFLFFLRIAIDLVRYICTVMKWMLASNPGMGANYDILHGTHVKLWFFRKNSVGW